MLWFIGQGQESGMILNSVLWFCLKGNCAGNFDLGYEMNYFLGLLQPLQFI
jgi:hypothetical protein